MLIKILHTKSYCATIVTLYTKIVMTLYVNIGGGP